MPLEYSPSLTVGRTASTATNCPSKVWKIRPAVPDLHNEATAPFCIPHARFRGSQICYFKTLFLSVPFCIDHRRFTAGIKLFYTGNVHAHLSPRPVAGLQLSSSLHVHRRKGSANFTWFLARRQSVVSLSCVTVYTSTHQTRTLWPNTVCRLIPPLAGNFSEKRTKIHRLHKKHGRSKLPFSVSLRISTVTIYYYICIIYMTYRLLQNLAAVAVAVVHSYRQTWPVMLISTVVTDSRRRSYTIQM